MRSLLAVLLVLVIIALVVIIPVQPQAKDSPCDVSVYIPWAAMACFWEMYFELGMGYDDWGDSDGLTGSAIIGDTDGVSGIVGKGDADGDSGTSRGDGDGVTGHR